MALVLIATPNAADANSYVTLAEATAYFEGRLPSTAWDSQSAFQLKALVTACRRLDREDFLGQQSTKAQALQFGRTGVETPYGDQYLASEIPKCLKDAQCELAYSYIVDPAVDPAAVLETSILESVSVGPLAVAFRDFGAFASLPLPTSVRDLIAPLCGSTSTKVMEG
jgi:hypothetical protein